MGHRRTSTMELDSPEGCERRECISEARPRLESAPRVSDAEGDQTGHARHRFDYSVADFNWGDPKVGDLEADIANIWKAGLVSSFEKVEESEDALVVGELHSVSVEKRYRTFVVEEPTGAHERHAGLAGCNQSDFAKDIPAEFGTRLRHGVYTCNH